MNASSRIRLILSSCLLSLFSPLALSSASAPLEVAEQVTAHGDQPLSLSLSSAISPVEAGPSKFNLESAEFAAAPEYFPALPTKITASPEPAREEFKQVSGYQWRNTPPDQPDWAGITRDAAYFLGYQFVGVALLYMAPESVSGWSDESKEDYSISKWKENVSNPVWDEDKFYMNYLLHPYWGGAYYIQARERGLDKTQSFVYSFLMSAFWEYGVEAVAEPVSKQDLIITPVLGFVVGEYVFAPLRQYIRDQPGEIGWGGKIVLAITDPLGVLNAQTDKIFGIKTTVRMTQGNAQTSTAALAMNAPNTNLAHASGIPRTTLGVELRMDW
jgi:hypothetical protein